jgi:hypothetical protein
MDSPLAPNVASYHHGTTGDTTSTPGTSLEQLYLMENLHETSVGDGSILYRVEIVAGQAQLTQLYSMTGSCTDAAIDCNVYFDQAHIGATPDGKKIYAVNRKPVGTGNPVGVYDVAAGTFQYLGEVSGLPANGTVLVGFSPDGELYAANMDSNQIYRLDLGTMSIAQAWQVKDATSGAPVDLNGADIAFGSDGTLYLWTNADGLGLYTVDVSGAQAMATRLGTGTYPFVTGLAIRDAGKGDLLGSSSENDVLYQIGKTDGALVTSYPLVLGGLPYDHVAGDMTAGLIKEPPPPPSGGSKGCTPGYWKQSQHFGSWKGYSPSQKFSTVFENAFPGMTLLQVLQQGGGGLDALGRHTVAALLNASSGIDFGLTTAQVIQKFNDVYPGGDYEALKNEFAALNERGCPLGRDDGHDYPTPPHDGGHDSHDCDSKSYGSKSFSTKSYGSKEHDDQCTCEDSHSSSKDGKYSGWYSTKSHGGASYNFSGSYGSKSDCDSHDSHDSKDSHDWKYGDHKDSHDSKYDDHKGSHDSNGSYDSKGSYGSKDSHRSSGHGLFGWLF